MKVAVITDTKLNFQYFLHSIAQCDRAQFVFVNSLDSAEGQQFSAVVRTGPYRNIAQHQDLYDCCRGRIA